MVREIRAGLIGFGTIGTGVVRLLESQASSIRERLGANLRLVRIADLDTKRDRGVRLAPGVLTNDASKVLDDPEIDIVIELMGGYEPAKSFVLRAIRNGKSIVTANKALLAIHGQEVFAAAEKARVDLGFEASVGGGIPIIRTLRTALAGDTNTAVYGIVNGTSNYILSQMTSGDGEFETVLKSAQEKGLAEANPSFDVDGIDSAHKLTLLAQLAFGVRANFKDVLVEGIRGISQFDIASARDFGYVIKLLAIAKLGRGGLELRVHPTMVPRSHLLGDVNGAYNAIAIHGEALGSSLYFGLGAGMMPTATAVVADCIDAARNILNGSRGAVAPLGYPVARQRKVRLKPIADLQSDYYLRFTVVDRPNVLARISGILGKHHISIAALVQQYREDGAQVPIVIRTHRAREKDVRSALRAIDKLAAVRHPSSMIRIEDAPGA